MDDLVALMQLIDLNSKVLPEGSYLEMCNRMKNIYGNINKPELPQTQRQPTEVPFQPNNDDDDIRRRQIMAQMRRLATLIHKKKTEIKKLEPWKRLSEQRKKNAIQDYARRMNIHIRTGLTLSSLENAGFPIRNPEQFFKSFMDRRNAMSSIERTDLQMDLEDLQDEYDILEEDLNILRNVNY